MELDSVLKPWKVRGVLLWLAFYMSSWRLHEGCFLLGDQSPGTVGVGGGRRKPCPLAAEGSGLDEVEAPVSHQ